MIIERIFQYIHELAEKMKSQVQPIVYSHNISTLFAKKSLKQSQRKHACD